MDKKIKEIVDYFDFLQNTYKLNIAIDDYVGFLLDYKQMYKEFKKFIYNKNEYCKYLQLDKNLYVDCLLQQKKSREVLSDKRPFYFETCHGGVGQYVIPIYYKDKIVGTIKVGNFTVDKEKLITSFYNIIKKSDKFNLADLESTYEKYIDFKNIDTAALTHTLVIISSYISVLYNNVKVNDSNVRSNKHLTTTESILTKSTEYIHENFKNQITSARLAAYCNCSESYLSHIFKKNIGLCINSYTNKIRIEYAKDKLLSTIDPISVIATSSGFSDPNYFSRIFTQSTNLTPSQFRKVNSEIIKVTQSNLKIREKLIQ